MANATYTVTIKRPIESVFSFIEVGENNLCWRPAVMDIKRVSGLGVGARYAQGVIGPMGRRIAADYVIMSTEGNRRLDFATVAGLVRPRGRYDLVAVDGGTRLTFSLVAELTGLRGLLMNSRVQKAMVVEVRNLDNLKRLMEA